MSFRQVAKLDDIPKGRGLCVQIEGVDIGLFRVGADIHAMENACPHAGDPLSEGDLDGSVVVCPSHGWQFDVRTGFRPDDADGFPIPCFAVRITGDAVEVDITQAVNSRRSRPRR